MTTILKFKNGYFDFIEGREILVPRQHIITSVKQSLCSQNIPDGIYRISDIDIIYAEDEAEKSVPWLVSCIAVRISDNDSITKMEQEEIENKKLSEFLNQFNKWGRSLDGYFVLISCDYWKADMFRVNEDKSRTHIEKFGDGTKTMANLERIDLEIKSYLGVK